MEKLRKQKIYKKSRLIDRNYTIVPEIRLEGKWLYKLGFKEGMNIVIQTEPNKLTIMVVQ